MEASVVVCLPHLDHRVPATLKIFQKMRKVAMTNRCAVCTVLCVVRMFTSQGNLSLRRFVIASVP